MWPDKVVAGSGSPADKVAVKLVSAMADVVAKPTSTTAEVTMERTIYVANYESRVLGLG